MGRRRALTPEQSQAAAAWFADFKRIGTFEQKAREMGVSEDTLRDAIKRARGEDPKPVKRKLTAAEIDRLVDDISRGTLTTESEAV
jgi:DNA invertase Pin-like site-specific DNA recombinase